MPDRPSNAIFSKSSFVVEAESLSDFEEHSGGESLFSVAIRRLEPHHTARPDSVSDLERRLEAETDRLV